jgi:hypothetical protein
MPVKLNSSGGGSVTVDVGSTASNFTQNLPLATTTLVGTDTTQTLTNKTLTSPTISGTVSGTVLVQGTVQNSTSGTNIDFTGIPSWVRRVTVMFNGVSTNGTSNPLIQLGDSGGIENTGYDNNSLLIGVNAVQSTAGFIFLSAAAANIITGQMVFSSFNTSNTWVGTGTFFVNQSGTYYTLVNNGVKTLSATLDRLRITTVNGTDAFDAGSINILYE